jgi:putative MATE family efflux protein
MGASGLASLNLAVPIFSFIFAGTFLLGIGGSTKYSILRGQGKADEANRVFTNTIIIAACFAAVFLVLGLFFSDLLAGLFGADEAIFKKTKDYLQVIMLFAPFLIFKNILTYFMRNDGAPGLAMLAMLSSSFYNIVFSFLFVVVLGWGMLGAALATGIGSLLGSAVIVYFFVKKKNNFVLVRCRVSPAIAFGIAATGLPVFVTEISAGAVIITFNTIILGLNGNVGLAAYGVILNIWVVVVAFYNGIAGGVQPLISRYHGLGIPSNGRAVFRYSLILVTILSAWFYLAAFFGASQITHIFNSENNPMLQEIAINGIRFYFIACVFVGLNIIISTYFTSTENPRPAHIISVLRGFLLIIPMAFLLSSMFGITGVWMAFPVTELTVCIFAFTMYLVKKRTRRNIGPQ